MFLFYVPAPAPPQTEKKTYWHNLTTKKYYLKEGDTYYNVNPETGAKQGEASKIGILMRVTDNRTLPWSVKPEKKQQGEGFTQQTKKPVDAKKRDAEIKAALDYISENYKGKTYTDGTYEVSISNEGKLSIKENGTDVPGKSLQAAKYRTIALQMVLNSEAKAGLNVDGIWGKLTKAAFGVLNTRPGESGEQTAVEKRTPVKLAQKQYEDTPRMRYDDIMDKKSAEDKTIAYLIESKLLTQKQIDNPTANEQKLFTAVYIMMLGRRYSATKQAFDLLPGILEYKKMENTTDNILACIWHERSNRSALAESMIGQQVGDKKVSRGNAEWWAGNFKVIVGAITPSESAYYKALQGKIAEAQGLLGSATDYQKKQTQFTALQTLTTTSKAVKQAEATEEQVTALKNAIDAFKKVPNEEPNQFYSSLQSKITEAQTLYGAATDYQKAKPEYTALGDEIDKAKKIAQKDATQANIDGLQAAMDKFKKLPSEMPRLEQVENILASGVRDNLATVEKVALLSAKQNDREASLLQVFQSLGLVEGDGNNVKATRRALNHTGGGSGRRFGRSTDLTKAVSKNDYGEKQVSFFLNYEAIGSLVNLHVLEMPSTLAGDGDKYHYPVSLSHKAKNALNPDEVKVVEAFLKKFNKDVEVSGLLSGDKGKRPIDLLLKAAKNMDKGTTIIKEKTDAEKLHDELVEFTKGLKPPQSQAEADALSRKIADFEARINASGDNTLGSTFSSAIAAAKVLVTDFNQAQLEKQKQQQQEQNREAQQKQEQERRDEEVLQLITEAKALLSEKKATGDERAALETYLKETIKERKNGFTRPEQAKLIQLNGAYEAVQEPVAKSQYEEELDGSTLINRAYAYADELASIELVGGIHTLLKEKFEEVKTGLMKAMKTENEAVALERIEKFVKEVSGSALMQDIYKDIKKPDGLVKAINDYVPG